MFPWACDWSCIDLSQTTTAYRMSATEESDLCRETKKIQKKRWKTWSLYSAAICCLIWCFSILIQRCSVNAIGNVTIENVDVNVNVIYCSEFFFFFCHLNFFMIFWQHVNLNGLTLLFQMPVPMIPVSTEEHALSGKGKFIASVCQHTQGTSARPVSFLVWCKLPQSLMFQESEGDVSAF